MINCGVFRSSFGAETAAYTPGSSRFGPQAPPMGAGPSERLPPYSAARSTTIDSPKPQSPV